MNRKKQAGEKSRVSLLLSILLALAVCLMLASGHFAVLADDSGETSGDIEYYVNDLSGLLTLDENWALEDKAAAIADTYGCGVYILTIDDSMQQDTDIYDFSEWFYTNYGLGAGDDKSAALLVINSESGMFATYFNGETAKYAFDSYGQEKLEDSFLSDLHDGEWQKAMDGFVTGCGDYLRLAAEGHPVRKNPAGTISVCIGLSCLISLLICLRLRSKMKSVHIGTGASNYTVGGIQLKEQRDQFTHTTQTRRKIEKAHSSGKSSARSGSSGGSGRSGSF